MSLAFKLFLSCNLHDSPKRKSFCRIVLPLNSRLKLRLNSYSLKITVLKYLVDINCYSLDVMLMQF